MWLKKILFSLEVFLVTLVMALFLWLTTVSSESQKNLEIAEVSANQVKNSLESLLSIRVAGLFQIRDLWKRSQKVTHEEFIEVSREVLTRIPGIEAIEFRDPHGRAWVEPIPAGVLQAVSPPDYFAPAFESQRQAILRTIRERGSPVTTPVSLLTKGEKGFALLVPVYRQEKYAGYLYAVINIDSVLPMVFDPVFRQRYHCLLADTNQPVYSTTADLRLDDVKSPFPVTKEITLLDLNWKMALWPMEDARGAVAKWVLVLGLVISLILAVSMWMFSSLSEQEELIAAQLEIAATISTAATPKNCFRMIGDQCLRTLGVDRCGIFIWREGARSFLPAWISSADEEDFQGFLQLQLDYGNLPLISKLVDGKQSVLAYGEEAQKLISTSPRATFRARTLYALPLIRSNQLKGSLTLACVDKKRRFTKREKNWLDGLAGQLAVFIEGVQLQEELQKQNEEWALQEASLKPIQDFVCEQFRSPLLSLESSAHMLRNECGPRLSSEGRYYLNRIMANIGKLDLLLKETIAKMGAGPLIHR
jgi:sensor domain CHASE-containing protein